eukprot:10400159-Alexandrium_andersonii.AAC.1
MGACPPRGPPRLRVGRSGLAALLESPQAGRPGPSPQQALWTDFGYSRCTCQAERCLMWRRSALALWWRAPAAMH